LGNERKFDPVILSEIFIKISKNVKCMIYVVKIYSNRVPEESVRHDK